MTSGTPSRQVDLAWAAGLFDGEGCVRIHKRRVSARMAEGSAYYILSADMTNTHYPTIERYRSIVGVGQIKKSAPTCWRVTAQANKAVELLELLYPYLCTKLEQADVAFEFARLPRTPGKKLTTDMLNDRESCMRRLIELKVIS